MATEYPVNGFRISAVHDGTFLRQVSDGIIATVNDAMDHFAARDDASASIRPSPVKWSPKEIIGHLIDSAGNNRQRIVRGQLTTELHFPEYEQNEWVRVQRWNDRDWVTVITLWRSVNLHMAHVVAACAPDKLNAACVIGADEPVTLAYIIEDYLGHMQHHLRQIPLLPSRDHQRKGEA